MNRVFVYGTLKRAQPNHSLVTERPAGQQCIFVSTATTLQRWPLVVASQYNVPFLLYKSGVGRHIVGEVWDCDDAQLADFDRLERVPAYYSRDRIELKLNELDGELSTAWCYFLKDFRPELLDKTYLTEYDYSALLQQGLGYVRPHERSKNSDYITTVKLC